MRTTCDNKEVPQTFSKNSPYSRKYDLIRMTPYHWQTYILLFVTLQKADFAILSQTLFTLLRTITTLKHRNS